VLMLCGQIPREQIEEHRAPRGQRPAGLHRSRHQMAPARAQVSDIPPPCARLCSSGRPPAPRRAETRRRPWKEGEAELLAPVEIARATASATDINRTAEILLAAKRPLIYAGGGVNLSGAHEALHAVANTCRPASRAQPRARARSATTATSRWAPRSGANRSAAIHTADVVLAVGSRLARLLRAGDADRSDRCDRRDRTHKSVGNVGDARHARGASGEAARRRARPSVPQAERGRSRAEIGHHDTGSPGCPSSRASARAARGTIPARGPRSANARLAHLRSVISVLLLVPRQPRHEYPGPSAPRCAPVPRGAQ
jgi:hypothetical protein